MTNYLTKENPEFIMTQLKEQADTFRLNWHNMTEKFNGLGRTQERMLGMLEKLTTKVENIEKDHSQLTLNTYQSFCVAFGLLSDNKNILESNKDILIIHNNILERMDKDSSLGIIREDVDKIGYELEELKKDYREDMTTFLKRTEDYRELMKAKMSEVRDDLYDVKKREKKRMREERDIDEGREIYTKRELKEMEKNDDVCDLTESDEPSMMENYMGAVDSARRIIEETDRVPKRRANKKESIPFPI